MEQYGFALRESTVWLESPGMEFQSPYCPLDSIFPSPHCDSCVATTYLQITDAVYRYSVLTRSIHLFITLAKSELSHAAEPSLAWLSRLFSERKPLREIHFAFIQANPACQETDGT